VLATCMLLTSSLTCAVCRAPEHLNHRLEAEQRHMLLVEATTILNSKNIMINSASFPGQPIPFLLVELCSS
jgi:hypothetical protein